MPKTFTISDRLIGITLTTATSGEHVAVAQTQLIPPSDPGAVQTALEGLEGSLLERIPGLPPRSMLDHLLVVIQPDLKATAYFNELRPIASVRYKGSVKAGDPVFVADITTVESIALGVDIPDDAAIVFFASHRWRRSLYFDFGPLDGRPKLRATRLEAVLAKQQLLLWGVSEGLPSGSLTETGIDRMVMGYQHLEELLSSRSTEESEYQTLLEHHPWMLGGHYSAVTRHQNLDDSRIPDFTATHSWDGHSDIIELKQPFTPCTGKSGKLSAAFSKAWNQTERYVGFAQREKDYLRREKSLKFENPRAILLIGHALPEVTLREIRDKESLTPAISVMTYDQLLTLARQVLYLVRQANSDVALHSPADFEPTSEKPSRKKPSRKKPSRKKPSRKKLTSKKPMRTVPPPGE